MSNQEREPYVLDFPNGQKVEDILKKADANYSKAEIDQQMASKATMSDVERETQNLQNQINEIVRAPESGGDVAAEVAQARVDADGVTHATLKARCDSDADKTTQLKEDLAELSEPVEIRMDITSTGTVTNGAWVKSADGGKGTGYDSYKLYEYPVNAGETYAITGKYTNAVALYCTSKSTLYTDSINENRFPNESQSGSDTVTKIITIPSGDRFLYCSNISDAFKVEKITYGVKPKDSARVDALEKDFGYISFENKNLKNKVIEEQLKNDFKWANFNGLYITVTFDDSTTDTDLLVDLAHEMDIPLCFATIPSYLTHKTTNGQTIKSVLTNAVNNYGCEVLSHSEKVLTSESADEDYEEIYITNKKILEENGFEVNGIIVSGGTNAYTQDFAKDTELARIYYNYSDITAYHDRSIEQFFNERKWINTESSVKSKIDTVASLGSGWVHLGSHGTREYDMTIDKFRELFAYAKEKGFTFVTWKTMYDTFKSSKLEERIKALENN